MIESLASRARPLRIGHMGAGGLAPANSLEAIEVAIKVGVDLIELDVWSTSDGHLVLGHFNWIPPVKANQVGRLVREPSWLRTARTWRHWPRITQNSLEALRLLPVPPPTLDEALDMMRGRAIPYLDLRSTGIAERLCAALHAGAPDGALLGSGPQRSFREELALMPQLQATSGVALPLFARAISAESAAAITRAAIRRARRNGASGLSVQYRLVQPSLLDVCREEGFFVFAWTVDDPADIAHMAELGVDGITSNRPDHFAAVLDAQWAS